MQQSIGLENLWILKSIFDNSKEPIVAVDTSWHIIAFNQMWQTGFYGLSGIKIELGMNIKNEIETNTELHNSFTSIWERALKGEAFVQQLNPPSQREKFFELRFSPLYNEKNELIGASQIIHEVTESVHYQQELQTKKKQLEITVNQLEKEIADHATAQAALVESEFLHKNLNELTQTFTWKFDLQGHFKLVNLSWGQVTGKTLDQSEGLGWIEAFHPEERESVQELWKNDGVCQKTFRLWCCQQQMYKYARIFIKPLYDEKGNTVEWLAAGIDVHELMETKENLDIASTRLNLALKSAGIGVFEWDLCTHELTIDQMDASILGIDWEKTKGKMHIEDFQALVHPEDKEHVAKQIKGRTQSMKRSQEMQFRVIRPDNGEVRWIVGSAEVHVHDGRRTVIGIHKDVTHQKIHEEHTKLLAQQAQEIKLAKQTELMERQRAQAAEEHKKRQEEFIDTICHEIRNPLTGVQGCVSLLREELVNYFEKPTEDSKERTYKLLMDYVDCIMECVHQQKVIVDDALDLSKLETSKLQLNPTPFHLKGLVQSVLQMHHATAVQKGLWLRTEVQDEYLWITADRDRIKQALVNLVSNAVKFTDHGGVSIRAELEQVKNNSEVNVTFVVEDTGIGVASEEISLLYTKFTQLRRTAETHKPGSGLGLAITKQLVVSMGGEVGYRHATNGGAVFYFTIPCRTAQAAMVTENEGERILVESSSVPRTVLIVDDSKLNQKILASYLEKDGHAYEVASNGQEAVDKCQQKHFDVIFMDVEMPIMNGYEATHILRQKEVSEPPSNPLYIVGLSGNARKEKVEEALKAGMDLYLTKPYHRADILKTVRTAPTYTTKRKRT